MGRKNTGERKERLVMLSIKPGVRIHGIRPELLLGVLVADGVLSDMGKECILTSVIDGTHQSGSLHYIGCAVDIRSRHLAEPNEVVTLLRTALDDDFDVIYEGDHIHIEYQPKRSY